MMLKVSDELRSIEHDDQMRFHEKHGFSKLKIGSKEVTPSTDMQEERIIAVHIYNGGPYPALVNLAYYYHYGAHSCNLAQDSDLGEAVYCYVDVATTLKRIDTSNTEDRTKCIVLLSGYLCKKIIKVICV